MRTSPAVRASSWVATMPKASAKASANATKGGVAKATPLTPAGEYKCPKCSNHIIVYVRLSCPPACVKHTGGPVIMEVVQ